MTTKIFRALMLMAVAAALVAPSTLSANEGRKIKREVKPSYPQLAKQMHVSGAVKLQAQVNGATQTGVVAARLNWAKLSAEGASINVLTSEKLTDIGRGATFYSTLVEVERA